MLRFGLFALRRTCGIAPWTCGVVPHRSVKLELPRWEGESEGWRERACVPSNAQKVGWGATAAGRVPNCGCELVV